MRQPEVSTSLSGGGGADIVQQFIVGCGRETNNIPSLE
jgi:hypothetical protein